MRLHKAISMAANAGAIWLGTAILMESLVGSANGQGRPMPPDPYDARQAADVAANVSTASPAAPPAATNVTDFPATEVRAVPIAMAQVAHARAVFDLSEMNVRLVVDQLKEDFEFSSQVLTALHGKQAAYDRYVAAQNRVLGKLESQNDYHTLRQLRDDLAKTLDELQANPSGNRARIDATAAVKMQYGSKLSQMESDALLADHNVQDAKVQFVDASNHLTDLRAQFARSIRRDATFVAARNQLDDARIQRDTSLAFLDGAVQARDIAMNYAYSLHQWDRFDYLSAGGLGAAYPYDVYGNGNGLGYGYGYPISMSAYNPSGNWRQVHAAR